MNIKAKCPYGNMATEVCTNKQCIRFNPFICNVCVDSNCYKNHSGCKFMSWNICKKKLSTSSYNKSPEFQQFVEELTDIYDKLLMMVEKEKSRFTVWHTTLGLNPKIVKFLNDVENGDYARTSGCQVAQMLVEGNPTVKDVTIKNPTKVDNMFFRQIDLYMQQVFQAMRGIYQRPNMTQYSMKDQNQEVPKLKKAHHKEMDKFAANNRQNIEDIKKKIKKQELDLRDFFSQSDHLRLLTYVDLDDVTKLALTDNQLKEISYFSEIRIGRLRQLYLDYNLIVDISPLCKCPMPYLMSLHLQYNQIVDLQPLVDCKYPELTTLQLNYNQIQNVEPLVRVKLPNLKILYLYDNNINNLEPFLKFNFAQLHILHIYGNKFDKQLSNYKNKLQDKFQNISLKIKI